MATGAPLPVREFSSVAEMQAHAAQVRARLFNRPAPLAARAPVTVPVPDARFQPLPLPPQCPRMTLPEYVEAMRALAPEDHKIASLVRLVSAVSGVELSDILSERRVAKVAQARHLSMWLCFIVTKRSLNYIGDRLGGRDHTTVLHAVRRVTPIADRDGISPFPDVVSAVERLWAADWSRGSR